MLRADSPTLVHDHELIESAGFRTESMPVPDRYGTHWMPAIKKIPPSRDFASAAGAMTVVQDRQALVAALREDHVPDNDHASGFAPWGEVVRSMTHDARSLVYLPLIVVAGLLVMVWIFAVNGPATVNYTIKPRATVSSKISQTTRGHRVPSSPAQRHKKPVAPVPSPSHSESKVTSDEPSPSHSAAPDPIPVPVKPRPTPKPTPRHTIDPKPTHTVEPTPEPTQSQTPDPQPTVVPTIRTAEPDQTPDSVIPPTPGS